MKYAVDAVEGLAPVGALVSVAEASAVEWLALALIVAMLAILIVRVLQRGGKRRGRRGGRGGNDRSRGGDGSCVEIYVGNLSYDMTEAQLRREFEKYGAVKSARIIENHYNKKSKGFGFVEMPVRPEAEAAINALHDKDVMGRKMRVNEAKNKSRD